MCGPRPFSSNKAETASSRLRFVILGVVEKILLHDPGGITVSVKGILSLILLPDDFLDPSVHRGTGGPAIGEQCHAVGDFYPYAFYSFQGSDQSLIRKRRDPFQIWKQLTLSQIGKEAENYTENCEAGKVTLQQFFPGTACKPDLQRRLYI